MMSIKALLLIQILLMILVISGCRDRKPQDPDLSSIGLLRGDIALCGGEEFGEVKFSFSCVESARKTFNLAVSLLHSFEYDEAEKAFVRVIETDPECAMAYWGVAMSNFHSLWIQSGDTYLEKGSKILAAAPLPKSARERDYLEAIGAFYHDWQATDHRTRILNFEMKMEQLYQKYEDDTEAAIFYALSLTASADPSDKTYRNQRRSGEILEKIFREQPNHPGISHYIIHNYDYPELAPLALATARRYAKIAPASAHAQHMPSHIFTRLGIWEEAISSDSNSTAAALCYAQRVNPGSHWDEELHGMDYLVYAYLQLGDNTNAIAQYEYLKTFGAIFPENFKVAYAAAAIPARIVLENRNWRDAATLRPPAGLDIDWRKFPWQKAIIHFARALGSIHLNHIAAAESELNSIDSLHALLVDLDRVYEARQVEIQMTTIDAWMEFQKGNTGEALALMLKAADIEQGTAKHPVTPGEVLPAGELLGDLYMRANRPLEALGAYENDLKLRPNRFNGLYGAAVAAKKAGDTSKARKYFQQLIEMTAPFQSDRAELVVARAYLED